MRLQLSLPASPGLETVNATAGRPAAYRMRGRSFRAGWLMATGDDSGEDTVVVRRRRPSGESSGPRERADAPEREQLDQGGGFSPGGGFSGGGGGGAGGGSGGGGLGGLPIPTGRGGCGTIVVIGLVLVVYLIFNVLKPGGSPQANDLTAQPQAPLAQNQPDQAQGPRAQPTPALAPTLKPLPSRSSGQSAAVAPRATPVPGKPGQKWTVMLYQDADDKVLDQDIFIDLNEAERVGSSDRVNVVAQIDRYHSTGGTRRYYVTRDQDLHRVASQELANLGDADMSDPKTLVDFVTWAVQKYPADKYVLILSDHGMGWPGGFSDASGHVNQPPKVPLASAVGNVLYLHQLDKALGDIRAQAGIDKFELIGLDACLMSQLEVYDALAPHARYAVASEETEPALGWAYTAFLSALEQNPDATGADLGRLIVQTYVKDDVRIADDQARAEFAGKGSPMGGFFDGAGAPSADQLAAELGDSITLSIVDLSAIPNLMQSVNQFSYALQGAQQPVVAQARTYAQSYTSIFGSQVPPSYIDLGHFAALVARNAQNAGVSKAANDVISALKGAVIAEKHGPKKPGSTGMAIYFPNSQLYQSPMAGPPSYNVIAGRFAGESLWPSFLAYHYTGRKFSAGAPPQAPAAPDRSLTVKAPGAGQITVSPVRLSSNTTTIRKPITMKADVTGQNVGYVYFFTGFYDQKANSINVADTDYLESPQTRQLNGVYYPDWGGKDKFTLQFDWEPLMFAISDGQTSAQVLLTPETYGVAPEQAVYTVDGYYTYKDTGETKFARLYFSNGVLRHVYGYTGEQMDGTGAPHEITPQTGDTFQVLQQWLDLDSSGKVKQQATQKGKTLTFGPKSLTWKELDAAAGNYIAGFIVEDLDGNRTQSFAQVKVQ
jgi:hypothetical protein